MTKCKVKINKKIRDYTEAIFFGLSLRQFIFSGLACGIAVGLYFLLHPYMSMETVSWICVLGAAPCVVFGFVKYHGMTAEQFIWAWIKSEILMPKKLMFRSENLYFDAVARTYKFIDINYAVASKVDKATSSNSMVQEKYVTVSCYKKTIEEARTYFARVTTELNSHFARRGSKCAEVNGEDKLRILNMKNSGQVINMNLVSVGTINASLVIPREVFKSSILANASAIIGLHNHPSGNVKPSKEDMIVTRKLQKCGQLLGIELLDHIIVGGTNGKMLSFREEKMLNVTGKMDWER